MVGVEKRHRVTILEHRDPRSGQVAARLDPLQMNIKHAHAVGFFAAQIRINVYVDHRFGLAPGRTQAFEQGNAGA